MRLQDIGGHLRGGIPERDIVDPVRLKPYWAILPSVRAALFAKADRSGYGQLRLPIAEVKPAIFGHAEFTAFHESATRLFAQWKKASTSLLKGFAQDGHPKPLIETIAEDLLATFKTAPLLDAYDVYQHLMDYWAATMQDDCYLIAAEGWKAGAPCISRKWDSSDDPVFNPNGIASFSPGLRGTSYPGNPSRQYPQP